METTITIRRWDNGNVIFSHTCEYNTISKTINEAVKQHVDLAYADLHNRFLSEIDMSDVNLTNANLNYTTIVNSVLIKANLSYASLKSCNIKYSDLGYIDLSSACLENALLSYVNMSYSVLKNADFNNARLVLTNWSFVDVSDTNLKEVEFDSVRFDCINFNRAKGINDQCPKEGSFIGWKKCIDNNNKIRYIVKLEIPADAKRSSSTSSKCRCSHAKVLEIQHIDGMKTIINQVYSQFNYRTIYKVGEMVYPDSFDDRFWEECSNGIHFFMNREDAVKW